MADIQFDEERDFVQPARIAEPAAHKQGPFIRIILKTGIVEDERQAEYVLAGIAIICLMIAIFVIARSFKPAWHVQQQSEPAAFKAQRQSSYR
jgi:hypothetical protein